MRETYIFLKDHKELQEPLDEHVWDGEDKNSSFRSDVNWREGHLGVKANYWNLAASDMPWQLSEGLAMGSHEPVEGLKPVGRHIDQQSLSAHPFFAKSQIVRNPFRCFHRSDGRSLPIVRRILLLSIRLSFDAISHGWS